MSLYLKYRPKDFKSIVGQKQVKDILKAEVEKNKLSSSYIFFGPRGTGKTSTARILAKAINCTGDEEKPCNSCDACKLINEGKTLDFVEIDAASNTQVDKIREEIIDKAIYPPTNLTKKVYIIDEVHMLSKSAFNALLKIMEEPPEYLVFILATTEIHKVPETIISRCEVFNFKRISQENVISQLKYIADSENIPYDEEGLKLIAKISDGGLRDAIKYLEQVSIVGEVNSENASKFLGLAPERQIKSFLETVETNDIKAIFQKIEDLQNQGIDLTNFIKDILNYLDEHLLEDLDKHLKFIDLFDEIYQNLKNYPSAVLAYKATLGSYLLDSNEKSELKKNYSQPSVEIKASSSSSDVEKKEELKNEEKLSEKGDTKISKDVLLKNISSPIVKGIIKNFGNVETNGDEVIITIISEANFNILNQADKKEILEESILKIYPNAQIKLQYMSKEEYFEKKLKN